MPAWHVGHPIRMCVQRSLRSIRTTSWSRCSAEKATAATCTSTSGSAPPAGHMHARPFGSIRGQVANGRLRARASQLLPVHETSGTRRIGAAAEQADAADEAHGGWRVSKMGYLHLK